jgi:uncharacterized membrane protein YdjX (TVP38/TMEM64 family)
MILRVAAVALILLCVGFAAWSLGVQNLHLWPLLAGRLRALQALASAHVLQAASLYVLIYMCVAACGLPLGPPMSITGGSVFGLWGGLFCAVMGATGGSLILFLVARGTIGRAMLRRRASSQDGRMDQVRRLVARDGFTALLALRMAPVVPGWLLNLAAALAHMRVRAFVIATTIGLLPATIVFTSIGSGLDSVLASDTPPGLGIVLEPRILLPLLALSGLTILPVIRRHMRRDPSS